MNAGATTKNQPGKRGTGQRQKNSGETSASVTKLAQVRLRPHEMESLRQVMRTLHLESTSDALREGLRLLSREAAEVAAAEEIRAFYHGKPAPLPEGVAPLTDAELAAADETEW